MKPRSEPKPQTPPENVIADPVDQLAIRVRAFTDAGRTSAKASKRRNFRSPHSDLVLIFDTETTVDAAHTLRFGVYQLRRGVKLEEAGIFVDPEMLSHDELALVKHFAADRGLRVLQTSQFVDEVLYGVAYAKGASIVGMNLPFDISRLAISHGSARGAMRGGFSLTLSADKRIPAIQILHINGQTSLIQFAAPFRQSTPRGMRRTSQRTSVDRGVFVDVGTLAGALLGKRLSLSALSQELNVEQPKLTTDDHGKALTTEYLEYAERDVQTTWECYAELTRAFARKGLRKPVNKVLSEASLGKAYLEDMGVKPWRECQPDFPKPMLGWIMSSYFGGRSEVRERRSIAQVVHTDFLSMYPTVCTLMGLWRFVIAEGVTWCDATNDTRDLLKTVTADDLLQPEYWKRLTVLVRLKPRKSLMPVRACYVDDDATIGLNDLTSAKSQWFSLADVIAARLLSGQVPEIEEAILFESDPVQKGLKPIKINGDPNYAINPTKDDFYRRLIDLRRNTKKQAEQANGAEYEALETLQGALKLAANATSYGIFVEVNVKEQPKLRTVQCYGPSGDPFEVKTRNIEEPGKYFHPLLATFITGAARLMLALLESKVFDAGLSWAFCDTDSMAITRPDGMPENVFFEKVRGICAAFETLNPYEAPGSILKVEDVNFGAGTSKELVPLHCFAISSKRYVLFNIGPEGMPIIRKASAHGLGHLRAPYDESNPAKNIPAPQFALKKIGVELWHHDLWYQIIMAALNGHMDQVRLDYHPALKQPAVSSYAATSPQLLNWFKSYNANRPSKRQVRPFGFLLSFPSIVLGSSGVDRNRKGKVPGRRKHRKVCAVAAFDKDHKRAASQAFDRQTGNAVSRDHLKTVAQALRDYHLSPEMKFHNGDRFDRGTTRRRHVHATSIIHIGKEANRWEEQMFTGPDVEAVPNYGEAPEGKEEKRLRLVDDVKHHGQARVAREMGISTRWLRARLS